MSEDCKKSEDLLKKIDTIACAYRDNLEAQYRMFRSFVNSYPKKKKNNLTPDVYTTVDLPKTIDEKQNKIGIHDFFTLLHDFLGSHKKTDGWNKKERDKYVSDYLTDDDKKLLEKTLYLGIPTLGRQKTALLRTWFNNKNELDDQYINKAGEFNKTFLTGKNIKTKLEPADLANFITHFPSPTAAATTFLYFLFPNQFIPYDDNTKKSVDMILMDGDKCCCGCEKDEETCTCDGCWHVNDNIFQNVDQEWKKYLKKINCLHCCWKKYIWEKLCLECCATLSEEVRKAIDDKIQAKLPIKLPEITNGDVSDINFLNGWLQENSSLFSKEDNKVKITIASGENKEQENLVIDPTQAAIYILGKYLEKDPSPSAWGRLKETAEILCEKCTSKEAGRCCRHWFGAYANLSDHCFDPAQTIALVFYAYVAHDNVLDKVLGKVLSQDLSHDDIAVSNVILSGIPGSGKTHAVMEYVKEFKERKKVGKYEIVQFHPSYDYEDFIEGLKPLPGGREVCGGQNDDGGLSFRLVNGVFKQLCKEAYENWTRQKNNNRTFYVMVIDEINRANLSRVFGELLYCLEYRDAWVETKFTNYIKALSSAEQGQLSICKDNEHTGKFNIPKNVVIVGTMNDVDRSIDAFDLALRRRFVWEEIGYTPYHLYVYDKFLEKMNPQHIVRLVSRATALNKELEKEFGPDFMIGHTYFYKAANYYEGGKENDETLEKALTQLWDFHLYSLLREYAKMKFAIEDLEGKLGDLRKIFVKEDDGA